jgi:ribose transport system ATP-binding protein
MTALLEACSLSKSYGANRVLEDVSLSINSGEVVALIGENGAGKSTLAKIISGIEHADSGQLLLNGSKVEFSQSRDAIDAGIGIVHQELCLADNLTITENICLGREPTRFGALDLRAMRSVAAKALDRLGCGLRPEQLVASLSPADRQLVEIARASSRTTHSS